MTFVFIGTKLKASADAADVYVLFESEVPESKRPGLVEKLPACIKPSIEWQGRILYAAGDAGFRHVLREQYGKSGAAGFDESFARWLSETDAAHTILCALNVDGKGTSPAPKKLAAPVVTRVLPGLLAHVAAHPRSSTSAWFLSELTEPFARSKLDQPTFVALAGAIEAVAPNCARQPLVRLLMRYRELSERAPAESAERAGHEPSFQLATLLADASRRTVEAIRALAPKVDASGAPLVSMVGAWLLDAGSQMSSEERAAIAQALAESHAVVAHRAPDPKESIAASLDGVAQTFLFPWGRERSSEDIRAAALLYDAAVRFADAPPAAIVNQLYCLVASGRAHQAEQRADAIQSIASGAPLVFVSASLAYLQVGREDDAVRQLELARKHGVDLTKHCADPVFSSLHDHPVLKALIA